jgi:hypothetical protein
MHRSRVRQDQVTHTQRHCEYQNQCHINRELLHDHSLKRNINNEFLKDRYGEPERGSEWEPIKFFSKEMETPKRRTRHPTHVSDSLPKLAKST